MPEQWFSTEKKHADVVLLGIPYDRTSSFGKGADKGPEAILKCFPQLELYERFTKWRPSEHVKIAHVLLPGIADMEPPEMVKEVSSQVSHYLKDNKFVIVLGGEHSIGAGIFDAWAKHHNPKDITIVQIDAHMDLRQDDSDYNELNPTKYAHSCVMRRAGEHGFHLVQVGIRAYADFELEAAYHHKVKVFEWPRKEDEHLLKSILNSIHTKHVYITLDVDGIDPAHMPSTGTPVQGGLSWLFTLELLSSLFHHRDVVGADIVEVIPGGVGQLTEFGAAQLAYFMIAHKFKHKAPH
jgi:agmatinase